MDETTCAWLAALVDGEGSIMLSKRTYSAQSKQRRPGLPIYRPVVVVAANTDYRLMDAIRERLIVGQVYEHTVSNTSKSYNPRKRRQWTYRLNVGQISRVLPCLLPWLVLKSEQAELLLEAVDLKNRSNPSAPGWFEGQAQRRVRLDAIYARIRELNTRGREVPEIEGGG